MYVCVYVCYMQFVYVCVYMKLDVHVCVCVYEVGNAYAYS